MCSVCRLGHVVERTAWPEIMLLEEAATALVYCLLFIVVCYCLGSTAIVFPSSLQNDPLPFGERSPLLPLPHVHRDGRQRAPTK